MSTIRPDRGEILEDINIITSREFGNPFGEAAIEAKMANGAIHVSASTRRKPSAEDDLQNGDGFLVQYDPQRRRFHLMHFDGMSGPLGSQHHLGKDMAMEVVSQILREGGDIAEAVYAANDVLQKNEVAVAVPGGERKVVPYTTVSAVELSLESDAEGENPWHVVQLGDGLTFVIPQDSETAACMTRQLTEARTAYINGEMDESEALLGPRKNRMQTCLGNALMDDPGDVLRYADDMILRPIKEEKPLKDGEVWAEVPVKLVGERICLVSVSDAMSSIPPAELENLVRETMKGGGSATEVREAIASMLEEKQRQWEEVLQNGAPDWVTTSAGEVQSHLHPDKLWETQAVIKQVLGKLDYPMQTEEFRKASPERRAELYGDYFCELERILAEVDLELHTTCRKNLQACLQSGKLKDAYFNPSMDWYLQAPEGKRYNLEAGFLLRSIDQSLPLRNPTICSLWAVSDACRRYQDRKSPVWVSDDNPAYTYLMGMGKKFVMEMRERMGVEGFFGEPGYEFILRSLMKTLSSDAATDKQRESIGIRELASFPFEKFYEQIYRDWIEANAPDDDTTIVVADIDLSKFKEE